MANESTCNDTGCENLITDEKRLAFVTSLFISHSLEHIDNQHSWRFNPGYLGPYLRGPTFIEALDNAIKALEELRELHSMVESQAYKTG